MQKQIVRVALFQNAKLFACLYFICSIPFVAVFMFVSFRTPGPKPFGSFFLFLAPFLYAFGAFISTIIGAWIYNLVAKLVGGFEYTTDEVRDF